MNPTHTIVERFEQAARIWPASTAVRVDGRSVTYTDVSALADRVAHALLEAGIRTGDRVALYFDRDEGAIAGVLGGLKSGAAIVPLMPSTPVDRLRRILADVEPAAVVTTRRHASSAAALSSGLRVITIEDGAVAPDRSWPRLHRADVACLLYTSGSTGQPKGVILSHACLLDKVDRGCAVFQPAHGDRVTLFSTYALGQGLIGILLAVVSGATSCAFDVRRDGLTGLPQWLAAEGITCYLSSVTLFRSLARTLDAPSDLPDLRLVRISGERVRPDDVYAHRRFFPNARLVVTYSSTETGCMAFHPVAPDEVFPEGVVPIGRPAGGVTVKILDVDGREVAVGTEGEITVQGPHLADGYWRDPVRTAAAFSSAADAPAQRFYRTGDLGRVRPDGLLEHLGRRDLRVKIRGFRVEIEDVESVLGQSPSVVAAAVSARPDAAGDLRLVAYVQPVDRSEASVDELRAYLALRLPEHMIPAHFVVMERLPTTPSGKIAREELPDPAPARPALDVPWVAPRSGLEATIADVWREVLGLERVGVDDPFLSVGGDSLKATLVASRLSSRLGVEIPLWVLFEASTVAELAVAVEQRLAPAR